MRASEFVSEYRVGRQIHPTWIDGRVGSGNTRKNDPNFKIMDADQSPIKELTLRWVSKYSPKIEVFVYEPKTDQSIAYFGAFPHEEKFPYTPTKEGVQILRPEIMINSKWQQKGIGSKLFMWYLRKYNAVFARDEHTIGAKALWDLARKAGFKNVYFDPFTGQGPKPNGKPSSEDAWRFIGRPELFRDLQS